MPNASKKIGSPPPRPVLWVMSELYYPEETSTGYYMTRIAEAMTDLFDVKVICGQPNYSRRGVRSPKREEKNGVEIFRAASTRFDKNKIFSRLVNMATLGISMFFASIKRLRQGDNVLVVTTPPNLPLIAAVSSLARGAAYTLLIHDNYPEMLFALGKMRRASAAARVIAAVNRWIYKHASRIIVVGRDMAEMALEKSRGLDIPIITIPNWAETDAISPAPKKDNPLLAELGLSEKFVLLYAGNIGRPNDVESIIECARRLADVDRIHFIFLGEGAKRHIVESAVNEEMLPNITVLAPRPRSEQQIFLNACDAAIVSLIEGMRGVSVPSRLYNILAAGKPVIGIAEPGSEVALVIEEEGIGWTVAPGHPADLAAIINESSLDPARLEQMGKRACRAAVEKYSLLTAIENYRSCLAPKMTKGGDVT